MKFITKLSFSCLIFLLPHILLAQPGTNDITFNTFDDCGFGDGSGFNTTVRITALQNDGKILIGGQYSLYNGSTANRLIRLNTDGSIDTSFHLGTGFDGYTSAIAVQTDGKILVGGYFTTFNGNPVSHFLRLNSDGTVDTTFNLGTGFNSEITNIKIQPDGKILAGGYFTSYDGTVVNRIARLNMDGTLDTSFDTGSGFDTGIRGIALQSDGKLVVGGSFSTFNAVSKKGIVRLNADGTLDATFTTGTGFDSDVYTCAVQADGKIVTGGYFMNYNGTVADRIIRLNTDGTVDTTFNYGTGFGYYVAAITIQPDAKIIAVGGFNGYNGSTTYQIARLNTDGTVDTTFSSTNVTGSSTVWSASLQTDGKIVIGGDFTSYEGVVSNRIARMNADGTRDQSFNTAPGFNNYLTASLIQSDGKIVIGGSFDAFNGVTNKKIARLNTDGSLDTTFHTGTGFYQYVNTLAMQTDEKIIVGGSYSSFNGTAVNSICRLNTDGSIDTNFVTGTGFNSYVLSSAIQTDGKIIIGGNYSTYNGTAAGKIARLNTDGSLDASFNTGTGFDNYNINSIAIQADGKIVVGGDFYNYNGTASKGIIRLNTDGSLDTNFVIGTGFNSGVYACTIQTDGKILVGGYFTSFNGTTINRIARLNTDGSLDTTFNTGAGFDNSVQMIRVLNSGKILAGGYFITYDGNTANRIILLNADGSPDTNFDSGTGFDNYVTTCSVQANGKLIIGGSFTHFNGFCRTRIARLTGDCTANSGVENTNTCDSYIWSANNQTYTSSGVYTATLTNISGCDSIVTLNLTINASPVMTATDNGDLTITASSADTYAWINCANGNVIPGENGQTLTVTQNGQYAVIGTTASGCTDTSACIDIQYLGIQENNRIQVSINPNPAHDLVTINFNVSEADLIIRNMQGQQIQTRHIQSGNQVSLETIPVGLYFFEINTAQGKTVQRIVKN